MKPLSSSSQLGIGDTKLAISGQGSGSRFLLGFTSLDSVLLAGSGVEEPAASHPPCDSIAPACSAPPCSCGSSGMHLLPPNCRTAVGPSDRTLPPRWKSREAWSSLWPSWHSNPDSVLGHSLLWPWRLLLAWFGEDSSPSPQHTVGCTWWTWRGWTTAVLVAVHKPRHIAGVPHHGWE